MWEQRPIMRGREKHKHETRVASLSLSRSLSRSRLFCFFSLSLSLSPCLPLSASFSPTRTGKRPVRPLQRHILGMHDDSSPKSIHMLGYCVVIVNININIVIRIITTHHLTTFSADMVSLHPSLCYLLFSSSCLLHFSNELFSYLLASNIIFSSLLSSSLPFSSLLFSSLLSSPLLSSSLLYSSPLFSSLISFLVAYVL
jgi:hypothetical protein